MFYSPMGYLASKMPRQYFYGVSRDLNIDTILLLD